MTISRTRYLRNLHNEAALARSQAAIFASANQFIDALIAVNQGAIVYSRSTGLQISTPDMLDYIAAQQYEGAVPLGTTSKRAEFGPALSSRKAGKALLADPTNQNRRQELLGFLVYAVQQPFNIHKKNSENPKLQPVIPAKLAEIELPAHFEEFLMAVCACANADNKDGPQAPCQNCDQKPVLA